MPETGVDASFTHQDAAQLAADGVKAIGRYCPGGGADPGKTITAAELQALNQHGIAVWLVYELSASRWRDGYAGGRVDGEAARNAARAIGWPDSRPIYTGFDENVGPLDQATATAYQQGFNDGQAAAGADVPGAAYGDGFVLRILTAGRLIEFKWLSDSTGFTESQQYAQSGQATIIQFYGRTLPGLSGIDVDDLLVADFGQYPAPAAPPPASKPTPEVEMFLFQEKGTAAVNVAPVGPRGYAHVVSPDRLTSFKAILAAQNPNSPFAAAIFPVNPGFTADLAAGAAGTALSGLGAADLFGPPIVKTLAVDAADTPITDPEPYEGAVA